ncbi:hypothetical protein [Magnetospirillum moscoviense]|uniref:Nucleotidase n=1 Tax=Magnetospirillum moscoviense TaxID=1437059 RepID=A0A178MC10_9PROT|nr:hypothetical protein [Magnetospirillum moscoviense]MBF0324314.1 hypothetical protein [Alphaproteobacteria bacterium]OAN45394.1 hypothetical protein A6A05_04550 [Magnetospirillum moscoviense]
MLIGLDLDNTLIGYDQAFLAVAAEMGLVATDFTGTKADIRAALRARPGGETDWQRLQGQVYGPRIDLAEAMPGSCDFIVRARALGHDLVIVSHKTRTGHFDPTGTDLRQAALGWLERQGYFSRLGFARDDIHFEDDRAAKLARIRALAPAIFIDDLAELLDDPDFPAATRAILLDDWAKVSARVLT